MQKNKDNIATKKENTRQSRKMKAVDDSYIVTYKDEYYFNIKEKTRVRNLGARFSNINSFFFEYLNAYNIPTGYKRSTANSILLQKHSRYSFGVKLLNVVDKRSSRIFSLPEGQQLSIPIIEFHYGSLQDNLISESSIAALNICSLDDLKIIKRLCSKVNAVLRSFFERRNLLLSEVYLYFGKDEERIFVVDDFTPRSLKVSPPAEQGKPSLNPYRMKTPAELKQYVEFLYGLIKS